MQDGSDVQSVLQTLRALQQQATRIGPVSTQEVMQPGGPAATPFASQLRDALQAVNTTQKEASALADGFVRGEHKDLVGTMVAAQKSSVAFQATLATRNRLVSAYQDIMNMPI